MLFLFTLTNLYYDGKFKERPFRYAITNYSERNDICYSWSEIALGMLILSIFLAACFLASIVS